MSKKNYNNLIRSKQKKTRKMLANVKKWHPLPATHNNLNRKLVNLRKQNLARTNANKFVMRNNTNLKGYNPKPKTKTKKKRSLFSRSSRSSSR